MKAEYHDIPTASAITATPLQDDSKSKGYDTIGDDEVEWTKGELQPPAYRDVGFAIAFWVQFLTIVVLGILYIAGVIEIEIEMKPWLDENRRRYLMEGPDDDEAFDGTPILWATLSSLVVAPALTILAFSYMYHKAEALIAASIWFAILFNVLLGIVCLVSGAFGGTIALFVVAAFTACYAKAIWNRIPYAAVNLKTAIASIQSQMAVAFLGLAAVPLYAIWWVLWIYVFTMTLYTPFMQSQLISTQAVETEQGGETTVDTYSALWYSIVISLVLGFFWTNQVFKNTVQTTVAGAVGTWWFVPDEASGGCCSSPALTNSLHRSLTYSFGSICFGSLLVAIIQTLKAIAENSENNRRNQGEGALLACIARCLLGCLERIVEYFNKWAFIYVGLYGYSYMDAGKNVFALFRHRGWTAVISDNLTSRVLGMMSFAIGLCTAIVAAVIAAILSASSRSSSSSSSDDMAGLVLGSAIVALIVGMFMASTIFGVVNSGVDTVIVLYAEAPKEFEQIHPELAREMNQAWNAAWPDIFTPSAPAAAAVVY